MAATTDIASRLTAVRGAIDAAATAVGRDPASVALVAVSKSQPGTAIRAAFAAGQRAFGENYPQELERKAAELADLALDWHFIGQLQANKTRVVAETCSWVHGIDRARIAERLAAQRPAGMARLQCCIQVNVSGEVQKGGVAPAELAALARAVAALPQLELRGLMCIPEPGAARADRAAPFRELRRLLTELRGSWDGKDGLALDTLSMGMSDDFTVAIGEGATLVRVGTAVFGSRG